MKYAAPYTPGSADMHQFECPEEDWEWCQKRGMQFLFPKGSDVPALGEKVWVNNHPALVVDLDIMHIIHDEKWTPTGDILVGVQVETEVVEGTLRYEECDLAANPGDEWHDLLSRSWHKMCLKYKGECKGNRHYSFPWGRELKDGKWCDSELI